MLKHKPTDARLDDATVVPVHAEEEDIYIVHETEVPAPFNVA